jgi:hypothetical protein
MGKYTSQVKQRESARITGVNPIMKGLGCFIMIIVPVVSYGAAMLLVNYGIGQRWPIPIEWLGTPQFYPWLWKSGGLAYLLGFLQTQTNLYANSVFALGIAKMLLDRNHLLLRDEAVPAAERLGVVGRILVIGGHVRAHDLRGVARDIEAGQEAVLEAHASDRLSIDAIPRPVLGADKLSDLGDMVLVRHGL